MRFTLVILILFALAFAGCNTASTSGIAGRWKFESLNFKHYSAFVDSIDVSGNESEAMERLLLDYRLVLRPDNTFDLVLFKKYQHGTWQYESGEKALSLKAETQPGTVITFLVDHQDEDGMVLRAGSSQVQKLIPPFMQDARGFSYFRQAGQFAFYLGKDDITYSKDEKDPYSLQNNTWRVKPKQPENSSQLVGRVKALVDYNKLMMQNVVDGYKNYVSLNSYKTPLIIDKENVRLQPYEDIREGWDIDFYDTLQAQQGYAILKNAVNHGVKPGTTSDRFKNAIAMLSQVEEQVKAK